MVPVIQSKNIHFGQDLKRLKTKLVWKKKILQKITFFSLNLIFIFKCFNQTKSKKH